MIKPIDPPAVEDARPEHAPAYLSNGVLGLRVRSVPLRDGVCIASGFAGVHPIDLVEGFARVPFPVACDVSVDGVWLSDAPERARLLRQSYDFSCGELHTAFELRGTESTARVAVVTFCSRTMPTVVAQEVAVTVDRATELGVRPEIEELGVAGRAARRLYGVPEGTSVIDGALLWESHGALSTCGVAFASDFSEDGADRSHRHAENTALATTYRVARAEGDRRYVLRQLSSVVPSAMHGEPDRQATRVLAAARRLGWDRLREQNRRAWDEIWLSRLELVGAERRWQALADASHFYLQSSVHASSPSSTSLFGLAYWPDYHYYRGHIMWDLDFFVVPALILTNPDAARALLEFRFERRHAAAKNARIWGYRGLQFPWESSIRDGDEATPGDGPGAAVEHHVSMDVAHAFAQFAFTSGDALFMADRAWPILHGVADWISSRVLETERGFEIRGVCGIAEKEPPIDNSAFTNMAASVALREAAAVGRVLGRPSPARWERIADRLVISMDAARTRIVSHDGYRANEEKGATPDPLAGFFPLGYEVEAAVEARTTAFYLERADDYVGSPMLSSQLGVWAARAGDRRRASALFERGYADFELEPFTLIDEYSARAFPEMPRAGPFAANIGGFLTGCLLGLPGIRPSLGEPETWCRGPVRMPSLWDGVHVQRLWIRGEPMELSAEHGDERPRLAHT
jgi:protein-glucosylgalactosylhydroxylysine glucosidase